ncbi:MAG TPA: hypothetical protein VKP69_08770, partial [Isosphaeraceae bacterium]|nr:hypothetical protein [Isosphaeraceae bacterium]
HLYAKSRKHLIHETLNSRETLSAFKKRFPQIVFTAPPRSVVCGERRRSGRCKRRIGEANRCGWWRFYVLEGRKK